MTGARVVVILAYAMGTPVLLHAQQPVAPASEASGRPEYLVPGGLTLAQAVSRALSQEPTLRAARADVDVAEGMRLQSGLRANPAWSVEQRLEPGGTDALTSIGVEWPLELFRRDPRRAVADAEVHVAELGVASAQWDVAAEVRVKYGDVVAAVRDLATTEGLVEAVLQQHRLLSTRVDEGATPALDRDLVSVEAQRLQADRLLQVARVEQAFVDLKRVMGLLPEAPLQLSQSLENLVADVLPPAPIPTAEVTGARADVREAAARVRVAEANLAQAQQEGRPDVTVYGSYMRMDAGFPQRGVGDGGALERIRGQFHYVAGGAMVTLPLWNRNQGRISATSAARAAAEARAEAARLAAASDMTGARTRYDQAIRALALYRDQILPLTTRNLDVVRETYELGRTDVFSVLTEQRRYLEIERAYTSALAETYQARAAVARAAGELP